MADSCFIAKIEAVTRQIRYLRCELERMGFYNRRFPEHRAEAAQYGVYFPTANDRELDDDMSYWKTLDKEGLPQHLVDRYNFLFRMFELKREKVHLKSLLAQERRRQWLAKVVGVLGLGKAQEWLWSKPLRHERQDVATISLEARAPPLQVSQADMPAAAFAFAFAADSPQAHAEIKSEVGHQGLECPICMVANVEVQLQVCKHKMCISCAVAVHKMPHPHCPFCRRHSDSFVPIPQQRGFFSIIRGKTLMKMR